MRRHYIRAIFIVFLLALLWRQTATSVLSSSTVERAECAAHDFQTFPSVALQHRKVYDLVMVNTELDLLEVRLHTLKDEVDYFVVVESAITFQGKSKPLTLRNNWERFSQFHHKLVYHQLDIPPAFHAARHWDREDLQRDAMYDQVFPNLSGRMKPRTNDVIIVADLDEIPRPETVHVLRHCRFPRRLTLSSRFYYYSFQFLHKGPDWPFPQATTYHGRRTIKPTNLRNGDGGLPYLREWQKHNMYNASWHCSSCFATMELFLNKMASFSHAWMNAEKYRDRDKIANAVRNGKDLWKRKIDQFERIENNTDVPPLLLEDPRRFDYLMSRDGPTAGFRDYP